MAVTAFLAKGTRLYMSPDGVTYTELVDLKQLGEPGNADAPDVDVTPLNPTTNYREYLVGMLTSSDFTFQQYFTATRFNALYARLRLNTYWRIVLPDLTTGSKLEFQAKLKKCSLTGLGNPDDPLLIDSSMKISGEPTFTAGS